MKNISQNPTALRFFHLNLIVLLMFSGLILSPITIHAQSEPQTEDVICLKNGGILRGEILEISGGKTVKIKTAGRNVFVIEMSEVDRITEEPIPRGRYYKISGYINHTGMDFLSGPETTTVRFQMTNGYRFNPYFAAGIGIGYIPYRDPLDLIPVYLDIMANLTRSNASPFLFVKAGYAFSTHTDVRVPIESHRGGWLLNPGIGMHFNLRGGFRWYFNAGYNVNNARFDEAGFQGGSIENELSYRRVMFGLGFSF